MKNRNYFIICIELKNNFLKNMKDNICRFEMT